MTLLPAQRPRFFIPSMSERSLQELGDLLKSYIKRSNKTQRRIAEEAGIPSPTYLSQMANARVNWVASEYFRPLSIALNLSVAEIADLNPDLIVTDQSYPPRNGSPIPPVVPHVEVPLYIPKELQELIDEYAHKPGYEKLQSHKALLALTALRNHLGPDEGPQTADQWLEYFLNMRRWLPQ